MNPENKNIKPGDLFQFENLTNIKDHLFKFCRFNENDAVEVNGNYNKRYPVKNNDIFIFLDKNEWIRKSFNSLSKIKGYMFLAPNGQRIYVNESDFLTYFKKVVL